MAPIMKRKAHSNSNKAEGIILKKLKQSTSTHIIPEFARKPSLQSSPEPSPATGSTSVVETEAHQNGQKSFQDLGIIESLCDACTALGYKVPTSL